MFRPEIVTLYKYSPYNVYSLSALVTRKVWFSLPGAFNDPFDCALTAADDALGESIQTAVGAAAKRTGLDLASLPEGSLGVRSEDIIAYKRFQGALLAMFKDVGLLCFSEVRDDLLMWSHYADSHRGLVIGFERTSENILGQQARPVKYQAEYPRLSAANFYPEDNPRSADVLWLTKSTHWEYEKEWRLGNIKGNMAHPLDATMCEVIFGMRMPEEARAAVRQSLGPDCGARYFEARRSPNAYRVEIYPLPA